MLYRCIPTCDVVKMQMMNKMQSDMADFAPGRPPSGLDHQKTLSDVCLVLPPGEINEISFLILAHSLHCVKT